MRKIGDTVRIREDLQVGEYGVGVVPDMVHLAGKTATITSVYCPAPGLECYKLDIGEGYSWTGSMLEAEEEGFSVEAFEPERADAFEPERADDYEAAVRDQIEHCWKLLFSKRKEYATADPFHNFRRAADLQGITKEQALIGMMDKHVISVHDMVNEAAEGASFSADKWREKIGDNINYLLILWAMVTMEGGAK